MNEILKKKSIAFVLIFSMVASFLVFFSPLSPLIFAETYTDGESLPAEITENSSVKGHIRQDSTSKIDAGMTLTIKDGGVLELGADTACINFLLENGGTLIIDKGGELVLDYTSDTVVHEDGIIYNYGTITNKGSFTLDGATVYNYGTFDNQLWINLNGGAKIYSAVPISGVNNITPLDPSSYIAQPIDVDDGSGGGAAGNEGGGGDDPDASGSGIVINVDPSGGAITPSGGGDVPENPADNGDTGGGSGSGDDNTGGSGSSGTSGDNTGGSGGSGSDPSGSGSSGGSGTSGDNTGGTSGGGSGNTGGSGSDPSGGNTGGTSGGNTGGSDDPAENPADVPANTPAAPTDDPSNTPTDDPSGGANKTPVNVVNNIPQDVVITNVDTSDKKIIEIATGKDNPGEDSLKKIDVKILGKKDGQKNYKTFYISPVAGLANGIHKTNLLFQYDSPSGNGKVQSTLSVPVKIIVGDNGIAATAENGVIGSTVNNWALLNLIFMALSILFALISIILFVAKKKRIKNLIFISIPIAAISVVLFFFTENIKAAMVIMDEWSGWMALIFAVEIFAMILSRKKRGGAGEI